MIAPILETDYFIAEPDTEADKVASAKSKKGTFSLRVKDEAKTYHGPRRQIAYVLQEPLKKEVEIL